MQLKDASILVVDDEPLLLKLVGDWFENVAGKSTRRRRWSGRYGGGGPKRD